MPSFDQAFRARYLPDLNLAEATRKAVEASAADHPSFQSLQLGEARHGEGVVMFLDIRGYTRLAMAFAEKPEETAKIIDAVVGSAVELLPAYGAHINDYTGDGVMAVFGGELGTLDHAHDQAIFAAVDLMTQMSATLRAELLGVEIDDPVQVAIGLVSGPILWKSVGSQENNRVLAIGEVAPLASKYVSGQETKAWQTMIGGPLISAVPPEYREKVANYFHEHKGVRMERERWLLDTENFSSDANSVDDVIKARTLSAAALTPAVPAAKPRVRQGSGGKPERTVG